MYTSNKLRIYSRNIPNRGFSWIWLSMNWAVLLKAYTKDCMRPRMSWSKKLGEFWRILNKHSISICSSKDRVVTVVARAMIYLGIEIDRSNHNAHLILVHSWNLKICQIFNNGKIRNFKSILKNKNKNQSTVMIKDKNLILII